MLTIYGHKTSTRTRKVLMVLEELQARYTMVSVDLATQEHKQALHIARQPFGELPVMECDGFVLYESRAICRYLNEVFCGELVLADSQARARMEQWISVETSNFTPHAMVLIFHHVLGFRAEPVALQHAWASLERALSVMNRQLTQTEFVSGARFSLADIVFMPYFEYLAPSPAGEVLDRYPDTRAWWARVCARSSWKAVVGASSLRSNDEARLHQRGPKQTRALG